MSTDGEGSVTRWIGHLKQGSDDAARRLWERYFGQLVRLAHARLRDRPRAAADEEDVALSAFDSFCAGVARAATTPTFLKVAIRTMPVAVSAALAAARSSPPTSRGSTATTH